MDKELIIERTGRRRASRGHDQASFDRNIAQTAKGGGVVLAGRSFAIFTRLVIAILLARLLGAEQYGLYNLALTAATIVSGLAVLGLDVGLVRYVATYASRRDERGLWGIIQIGIGLPLVMSLMLGAGLAMLATPIAEGIFHEPRLAPLLQLAGFAVPSLTLIEMIASATRGFKNMHYTVISRYLCQPFVRVAAMVGFAVFVGLTAGLAIVAFIIAGLVGSTLLFYFLNKQFSLRRPFSAARRDFREILTFSLPSYLASVIGNFSGSIQTIALGTLTTITHVGVFSVAGHINLVSQLMQSSVTTSAMPVMAELYDRADRSQLARFYQVTSRWTFTLVFPLFLIVFLFPEMLLSIFGESFVEGAEVLMLLAWSNLVSVGTGTCGVMLDMTGHTRLKLVNTIVTVATTIGLNLLLIPQLGMVGAAYAALIGSSIVNGLRLAQVFIVLRILPYNASYLRPLLAGLIALLVSLFSGQALAGLPILVLVLLQGAVLVAAYGALLLALGLGPEEQMLLERLLRRMRVVSRR